MSPSTAHSLERDRLARRRRVQMVLALAVLLPCAAYFGWRGPWRAVTRTTPDLPTFHSAARAWLHGENPYDVQTLQATYEQTAVDTDKQVYWFLNPPGALPLLAPLGLMSFSAANLLWLLISLGMIGAIAVETARWGQVPRREPAFVLLLAFILALSPFHTSVAQGQLSIAVTLCVMLALWADERDRPVWTGVLLAVAAALKPQMVFTFGLYYLVCGRWRVCLAAAGALAALMLAGIGPMEWTGVGWWSAWREGFIAADAAMNDPSRAESNRYIILSLPMLLYAWTDSAAVVQTATLVVLIAAGALTVWIGGRRPRGERLLVVYSLLAQIALLGAYHRIYDATVLVLPLALAAACWRQGQRGWAAVGLLAILPMIVSGAAVLVRLTVWGMVPSAVAQSMLWRGVILPHAVWLVLLLLAWTAATGIRQRADSQPPQPSSAGPMV